MRSSERSPADERGAILVFGIFFCVLCISLVYYLWGIADAVRYRERVQDAADMGAFGAAVVHAHGMNLVAFLNMVMAALLAVLVALRLLLVLVYVAIGAIGAVGWMTGGALYASIPPIQQVGDKVDKAADKLEPVVHKLIKVVHVMGDVIIKITPATGTARVAYLGYEAYRPDVDAVVAIPSGLTLPVEDDEFEVLCGRAGKYVGQVTMVPFTPVLPDAVRGAVAGALEELTKAGSGWFCGEGGAPPEIEVYDEERVSLPEPADRRGCAEAAGGAASGAGDDEDTRLACDAAALYELSSMPDRSGGCRMGRPKCPESCPDPDACPPSGTACNDDLRGEELKRKARKEVADCRPLEWRKRAARNACPPGRGRRALWWSERAVTRTYVFEAGAWHMIEEVESDPRRLMQQDADSDDHPCGDGGLVGEGFAPTGPVCESEPRCVSGRCERDRGVEGERFREEVRLVTDLLGCVLTRRLSKDEKKKKTEETDVRPKDGEDDKLAPFKFEEGLWLGDDDLQIRAFAYGGGPDDMPGEGVRLAALGRDVKTDFLGQAGKVLERFGVSQSEFYFAGDDAPARMPQHADLLWSMNWRARLRVLRLGGGGLCDGGSGSQSGGASGGGRGFSAGGAASGGGGLGSLGGANLSACQSLDGALAKPSPGAGKGKKQ